MWIVVARMNDQASDAAVETSRDGLADHFQQRMRMPDKRPTVRSTGSGPSVPSNALIPGTVVAFIGPLWPN